MYIILIIKKWSIISFNISNILNIEVDIMQEYSKKIAQKGVQQNNAAPVQAKTNGIPNSALTDVFAGKRHADSSMMGHSQNLAPSIAAKMSRAFGMDLTGMQVYRSEAMAGTGMRGMAQGNKIVLSSEVNLNTTAGQAVLGHEISHIHAQSQGVGMGHSGLYENAALEHQADTEGLLAAQGRSIYSDGMDMGIGMQYGLGMQGVEGLTPLSGGMSASAGAPMQAKKPGDQSEANQMAYDYAQGRAGKLKLDGKSQNELKKIQANEQAAVMKYVRSLSIPKGKLKEMNEDIGKSAKNLEAKNLNLSKDTKEVMLWHAKDNYYNDLYDAAMGKKKKGEYSGISEEATDAERAKNMENPYQNLDNAISGKKEESSAPAELPGVITGEQIQEMKEQIQKMTQSRNISFLNPKEEKKGKKSWWPFW